MYNIGFGELLVTIPLAVLSIGVPIVVIVLQIMILRKVDRIEQRLEKQED